MTAPRPARHLPASPPRPAGAEPPQPGSPPPQATPSAQAPPPPPHRRRRAAPPPPPQRSCRPVGASTLPPPHLYPPLSPPTSTPLISTPAFPAHVRWSAPHSTARRPHPHGRGSPWRQRRGGGCGRARPPTAGRSGTAVAAGGHRDWQPTAGGRRRRRRRHFRLTAGGGGSLDGR